MHCARNMIDGMFDMEKQTYRNGSDAVVLCMKN